MSSLAIDALIDTVSQAYQAGATERAYALLQPIMGTGTPSQAWNLMALIQLRRNQPMDALAAARRATRDKTNPGHFNTLGLVHEALAQFDAAASAYRRAATLLPTEPVFRYNLGNALMQDRKPQAALDAFTATIKTSPTFAPAWNNAGRALKELDRAVEAEQHYRQAIALRPGYHSARYNLGCLLLTQGRWDEGWPLYDSRWGRSENPDIRGQWGDRLWDGRDIAGQTLTLWTEQGLGDNLQFIRYVPALARQGIRVVLCCPPSLADLFSRLDGVAEIRANTPVPVTDGWHLPVASLPVIFRWHPEDDVNKNAYLSAPHLVPPLPSSAGRLRVGLMWAGKPLPDPFRTCPLAELAPLLDLPGISFFSLQTGDAKTELQRIKPARRPIDLDPGDFAHTAGLIDQLDLVISVDTSLAHLAGGLGVPTWVMLPHRADWRWMTQCQDTPWYPHTRLFRQKVQGKWSDVVREMATMLPDLEPRLAAAS